MAEKKVIELIQTLRGRTGAGMMDCKKALEENGLDIEKAIDWLREKGIAKQAKRAGRVAAEGATSVRVCPKCGKGVIAEVNCETDFVANSDKFRGLVNAVLSPVPLPRRISGMPALPSARSLSSAGSRSSTRAKATALAATSTWAARSPSSSNSRRKMRSLPMTSR